MNYKQIRYIIITVCLSLIILRIIFPDLKFDTISMTLLGIAVLAILIPDVDKILSTIKKLKFGSAELELHELNKTTEKVEDKLKDENLKNAGISGLTHRYDFAFELQNDLPTTILKLSIDIEKAMREIYEIAFKTREERPLATSKLIDVLRQKNIFDEETTNLLKQFWKTRNTVVHGNNSITVTEKDMLAFSDIGIRLLKILKNLENNLSDGKVTIYRQS
jgi:uncharacterized protein YutE (UPF0331/DUF86 family)